MNIGEKFKDARLKAHMTQKTVAEKLGCSIQNVSQLENGKHTFKYSTMVRLSNAIGVPVGEIWTNDETNTFLPVSAKAMKKMTSSKMITEKQKESARALAELATVVYMSALKESGGDLEISETVTNIILPDIDNQSIVSLIDSLKALIESESCNEESIDEMTDESSGIRLISKA